MLKAPTRPASVQPPSGAEEPPQALEQAIRDKALSLGFVRCGISSVAPLDHEEMFQRWIDAGYAASMDYLRRTRSARAAPALLLPSAASAIVVAASTLNRRQRKPGSAEGQVARFARGADYHGVVRRRLEVLGGWLRERLGTDIATRVVVDSAPLLERELAMRAGVGFIGKNTLLISPGVGSHTVLGTLLTTVELRSDSPSPPRCGECDLCLRSCPTRAFPAAYVLDARRCISYLTIEHKGDISVELRSELGGWLFGCDACQEACPYNSPRAQRGSVADGDLAPDDGLAALPLAPLLRLKSGGYRRLVRGRALGRASRRAWQRNAALAAAGVTSDEEDLAAALESARADSDPVVAESAAWARLERDRHHSPENALDQQETTVLRKRRES